MDLAIHSRILYLIILSSDALQPMKRLRLKINLRRTQIQDPTVNTGHRNVDVYEVTTRFQTERSCITAY